jgi:hypothetical protein
MDTSFRFLALPFDSFASLFELDETELHTLGARRVIVEEKPGAPCRVSLVDAEVGETAILVPFQHHEVDSPYRASGPIFVRQHARQVSPGVGEVPDLLRHRLLSVRAYDPAAMMVDAEVVEGKDLEGVVARLFAQPKVSYLHVHNARPGCYNCKVVRARPA